MSKSPLIVFAARLLAVACLNGAFVYSGDVVADIRVTKTAPATVAAGSTFTYTMVITNDGPNTAFNAVLDDTLPAGTTFVSMTAPAFWNCTVVGNNIHCVNPNFFNGNTATFPVLVKVDPVGVSTLTNTVNVISDSFDPRLSNNQDKVTTTVLAQDIFQVRFAANLTSADSVINITNTGANGAALNGPGFGGAAGNICVNVYAFSPDEQLVSCCSCLITPNGLVSLSVNSDLISNTLTGVRPNSVVVKLVNTGAGAAFTGTSCTNSAALAGGAAFPLAGGFQAFGTTVHAGAVAGSFAVVETPFSKATLSAQELASITNRCTNIVGNGSTFGICRSCRAGGLNAGN